MLKPKTRRSLSNKTLLLGCFVLLSAFLLIVYPSFLLTRLPQTLTKYRKPETLVIYLFGNTDPEYLNNFNFFLKHGVRGNDGATYLFVLDHEIANEIFELPPLPTNVQVVKAVGPCNEMGLVGWLFKRFPAVKQYKYYIILNSSVRGPFVPAYVTQRWHEMIVTRLTAQVKLVGATISCLPFKYHEGDGGYVTHPYVASTLFATDRIGLEVLNQTNPSVFHCFHDPMDIKRFGEIGLSEAILKANYNLDCLMLRYQGIDWRDPQSWDCNGRLDPHLQGHYDGWSVDPLEVMFIPVEHSQVVTEVDNVAKSVKYEQWSQNWKVRQPEKISSNEWLLTAGKEVAAMRLRGKNCFNAEYYIKSSPFEFKGYTSDQAWEHFISFGYSEGRPYKFQC